jgi:tetratricopeptide (TPR) repeat protein
VTALETAIAQAAPQNRRQLVLRLSDVLEAAGDQQAAWARLSAFSKEDPADREALRRLATLEARSESWEAAVNTYRKLLELEEGEALVDTALNLADACEHAGSAGDARAGLERALEVSPEHPLLRARLRDILVAAGANREVAEMLIQDAGAAQNAVDRLEYLLAAAEWLLAPGGDPARAITVLLEARAQSPESLEGLVLLARAYAASGKADEALKMLEGVATAQRGRRLKQYAPIYQEMSRIQLDEGMLSDALESLTRAFEMDLRNGPLAMELGRLALEVDEEEVATRAFRTVTMMRGWDADSGEGATPEDKADAHYHLALSARKQGDARKAKILVSKALVENPDHDHAKQLQSELEAG